MTTTKKTGKSLRDLIDVGENPEQIEAELTGSIPDWLNGILIRNGPGKLQVGPDEYQHLFDGLALLQKWTMKDKKVFYQTKFLRSNTYEKNIAANRIVISEFGTVAHLDPCKTLFHRYFTYLFPLAAEMTDNALVNIIQTGDQVYAMTETPSLCRINPENLETIQNNINVGKLVAVNTQTAHSHYTKDGDLINLGTGNGSYHILRVDKPDKQAEGNSFDRIRIAGSIPFSSTLYPSYYHSFGMSEKYVIFPEMPLTLSLPKMIYKMFTHQSFQAAMSYDGTAKTRFHILELESGEPVSKIIYTSRAFFTFHHINAYTDSNGNLIVDCAAYEDDSIFNQLKVDEYKNQSIQEGFSNIVKPAQFWRFVIPLTIPESAKPGDSVLHGDYGKADAVLQADGSVHLLHHVVCPQTFELPRINYAFNGQPYKYCYGAHLALDGNNEGLYKIDVISGEVKVWSKEDSTHACGEPVFIARPGSTMEDDGVVVAPVSSADTDSDSFLVVLDAATFTELARAHVKLQVPFGFHAHFMPESSI